MEKLTILLDSDGVLSDIANPWCKAYNEMYDDNLPVDAFIGYKDLAKLTKCGEDIFKIIEQPGFFEKVLPLPGAVDSLRRLDENPKLDCYILTAYSGNPHIAYGKMISIPEHFSFFDPEKIIMCHPKFLVYGNVLIDDSIKNLLKWSAFQSGNALHDHHTVLISDNADDETHNKVDSVLPSVAEAADYIENILL